MPNSHALSRRKLLALGGALAGSSGFSQDAGIVNDNESGAAGNVYHANPGPWGNLSFYYFYIEAPDHLIDLIPSRSAMTRWAVPASEEAALLKVIESAPLTEAQRKAALNPNIMGAGGDLFALFPPAEVVEGLSKEARSTIYQYLSLFECNPDIKYPIRIRSGSVDEWAAGTTIRPDLVKLMKSMAYHKGDLLVFADMAHIYSLARSEAEAKSLLKYSSRVRSTMVMLNLDENSPIDKILDYWSTGLGLRRKEIEPLLNAIKNTPGVHGIDLVHLLPPLPRKLLYTYPDFSFAADGVLPDCHWTTLNFFNYNPETLYLDEFFAASHLLGSFEEIEAPYKFGDAIIFVTRAMAAHHSCIYLGANLVYTKNGRSIFFPWTILHLDDVRSTYPDKDGEPLEIKGYRRRNAPA